MISRTCFACVISLGLGLSGLCRAQLDEKIMKNDTCILAYTAAWSYGNAFVVEDHFVQLYDPHASALLAAEKKLATGTDPKLLVEELRSLPGIKGVVFSSRDGRDLQSPEGLVDLRALGDSVFNWHQSCRPFKSPMMHRKLGGQVQFVWPKQDSKRVNLLVRYVCSDTTRPPTAAFSLVLDPQWLVAQIPSQMDSLARESVQLLFYAASPTNKFWEQSLGIIYKDTLWWSGPKDVEVANMQPLWPFVDIWVYSHVRPWKPK
jgi:hypothetical protein